MDSSSLSVGAAGPPAEGETLPLLNRLADFCVVYGVDHLSFVRNNESRNRFSSLLKWVSPCGRVWCNIAVCVRMPAPVVEGDTRCEISLGGRTGACVPHCSGHPTRHMSCLSPTARPALLVPHCQTSIARPPLPDQSATWDSWVMDHAI